MADQDWWAKDNAKDASPAWHQAPPPPAVVPPPPPAPDRTPARPSRRTWTTVAAVAALTLTAGGVWQHAQDERRAQEREQKAAVYKGRSGTEFSLDGVQAEVIAQWNSHRDHVTVELRSWYDKDAKYLRITASDKDASKVQKYGWYIEEPAITLPVHDYLADVSVRVEVGGKTWTKGTKPSSRTVRLSPTDLAYDAKTGQRLPHD
ncbi:hypothetical protein ACTWQF_34085 [Streptomyces sp. 8N114]|uniref:hypothetical protein n=1 Tax=Streptomyces sp. 8N114 TaxID=3457419 RepID=UPI003FD56637